MKPFDYSRDFTQINFREHPELYQVGRGEQGVLLVEPYKSELLPHWRFRTPALAQESAQTIYALFLAYKAADDFVGMDMARKFLQMGYTRARRYANHRSGRKYDRRRRRSYRRWRTGKRMRRHNRRASSGRTTSTQMPIRTINRPSTCTSRHMDNRHRHLKANEPAQPAVVRQQPLREVGHGLAHDPG